MNHYPEFTFRQQLALFAEQLERFADAYSSLPPALRPTDIPGCDAAASAIRTARPQVVVLGAEGHGKSTLVNGLVGTVVTPVDPDNPGTVAPVLVEWGSGAEPEFRVEYLDERPEHRPRGLTEFTRLLLNSSNPRNEAGVARGLVRINAPALRSGLCFLDSVGIEGVYARDIGPERLKVDAPAGYLLVCKDRSYAPALRLMTDHDLDIRQIVGIVLNLNGQWWNEAGEAGADRLIASARAGIADELKRRCGVEVDRERIFVVHAPSLRANGQRSVTLVAQERNVHALRTHLERFASGATGVDVTRELRNVMAPMVTWGTEVLRSRRDVIARCKDGPSSTFEFDAALRLSLARWDAAMAAELKPLCDLGWTSFEAAAKPHVVRFREQLQPLKLVFDDPAATALALERALRAVDQAAAEASGKCWTLQARALGVVDSKLCEAAEDVVQFFFSQFPFVDLDVPNEVDRSGMPRAFQATTPEILGELREWFNEARRRERLRRDIDSLLRLNLDRDALEKSFELLGARFRKQLEKDTLRRREHILFPDPATRDAELATATAAVLTVGEVAAWFS